MAEAIDIFLDCEETSDVAARGELIEGKDAHFYGNIGRCLFLMGKCDEALDCYAKSARLLEQDSSEQGRLNRGYVRYWIGELLVSMSSVDVAAASYRAAICIWEDTSPPRAEQARQRLCALVKGRPELRSYVEEVDWKVEERFGRWLDSH